MAPRGECAASGASAVRSAVSELDRGSIERRRDLRVSQRRRRLSVARQQPRHKPLAVEPDPARQVDDELQPFVEATARLARVRRAGREPGRVESHDPDRARRRCTLCAASIQPIAAAGVSASRLSTTKTSRPGASGRPSDSFAERGEKRARGRCRSLVRVQEVRARRAGLRLAADSARRRLGDSCRCFRVGGQRSDPLVEPRQSRLQIASPVAQVVVEKMRSAKHEAGEADCAEEVQRQRQTRRGSIASRRPS